MRLLGRKTKVAETGHAGAAEDLIARGDRFSKERSYQEALSCYDSVLAAAPDNKDAWRGKAEALAMNFRYEEAIAACDKSLERNPMDASLWFLKSFCAEMQGDYEQALQSCENGLKLDPKNTIAWCNKGLYLYAMGRLEDSVESFAVARGIDPDGRYVREANEKIQRWLQRDGRDTETIKKVLSFLRGTGYKQDFETYEQSLDLDPRNQATTFEKDFALAHMERPEKLLAEFERERREKQPDLVLDLSLKDFEFGHWSWVEVLLSNKGSAPAREVRLSYPEQVKVKYLDVSPGAVEERSDGKVNADIIAEILPGNHAKRLVSMMPLNTGRYPLSIVISYLDLWGERQEKTAAVWINIFKPGRQLPVIPGYTLLWKMASSNADIYVGKRTKNDAMAVIKAPRLEAGDTRLAADFLKAADEWSRLNHPGIVRVLQFGEDPFPWVALEYKDKGPLTKHIGRTSTAEALRIAVGLADALIYSRQMHITHRFINPSNVLISGMDGAKLTNWRVAAVTDKLSLSRSDGEKEFLAYSAPEQVDARLGGSDWSTDVYQFGMLLYHMLARRLPSAGSGEDNPPASGIITTGVSEPLDHLVIKCLAMNKNDRYRDMRALKAELEQAIAACNDAG